MINFINWFSTYNVVPLGMALRLVLLNKEAIEKINNNSFDQFISSVVPKKFILNDDQKKCLEQINKKEINFNVHVIEGVTGSGKTLVYFERIKKIIKNKNQALVLLPEIFLTNDFKTRFEDFFGFQPAIWHSKITPKQKRIIWKGLISDKIKILVLGGSQAAKAFADELPEIFQKLKKLEIPLKVYQQCQIRQNDQLAQFYKKNGIDFEIFNFTSKIIDYYLKSNLVITRAGASVLGELINIKIPFIAIPLPTSADNHQYKNAEFYLKKGYGYLLQEKDIKNKLFDLIESIFKDKSLTKKILSNQNKYSDKGIFSNLTNQLEKF